MTDEALPPFVAGLALSERFFRTAVEPLITAHFPDLRYAPARLGRGSDVMTFDTPQFARSSLGAEDDAVSP